CFPYTTLFRSFDEVVGVGGGAFPRDESAQKLDGAIGGDPRRGFKEFGELCWAGFDFFGDPSPDHGDPVVLGGPVDGGTGHQPDADLFVVDPRYDVHSFG